MLIFWRYIYYIILSGVMFICNYAETATFSKQEFVECPESSLRAAVKKLWQPHFKVTPSVTLDGVYADGYSKGLITKVYVDLTEEDDEQMSEADERIMRKIFSIWADVMCIGSGKIQELKLEKGEINTFVCDKGDGLQVRLYDPERGRAREVQFTLTLTADDETTLKQAMLSMEQPVTNGMSNGRPESSVRATAENGTTTQQPANGVTENDRLVRNGVHGDPDAPGGQGCCGFPWGSS